MSAYYNLSFSVCLAVNYPNFLIDSFRQKLLTLAFYQFLSGDLFSIMPAYQQSIYGYCGSA